MQPKQPKKRGRSILVQTQSGQHKPGSPNKSRRDSSLASPQSIELSEHEPTSPTRNKLFLKPPQSSQALRASKTFKEPLRPINQPSGTNNTFASTKTDEKSSAGKDSSSKGPNPFEQLQEIQDMIHILSQYPDLYMNFRGHLNQGKPLAFRASEMGSIHDLRKTESRNSGGLNPSESRGSNRSSSAPHVKNNRRSHPQLAQRVLKVNKIDLVVEVLKRINQFVSQHNQSLGFEIQYNPKKFENDLKFYREWFRLREERQKKKYDFFYGPFEDRKARPVMAHIENQFKNKRRTAQRFDLNDLVPGGASDPMLNKNHSQPIYDRAFLSSDDYKKDLQNYFITYVCDDCDPKKATNSLEAYREMIQKFWGRITELITGPDHEYVYLKKLIQRIKEFNPKKNDKVYLRRRAKMTGISTSTGLGLKRQQSSRFGDSQRLSTRVGLGTSSPTKTASSSSQTRAPIIRKSLSKFSPGNLFIKNQFSNGEKRMSRNSPMRKNLKRLSEVQSQEKSTSKMSPSLVSDSSEIQKSGKTEDIIITKSFQDADGAHQSPSSPINLNLSSQQHTSGPPSFQGGINNKNLTLKEITESDNERDSVQVDRRNTSTVQSPTLDPPQRKSYMLIESHVENTAGKQTTSPLSQEFNQVSQVGKNMFEFDELGASSSQMPLSSKSNHRKRLLNNTTSSSRSKSKTVQSKRSQRVVNQAMDKKSSERAKRRPHNSDLMLVTVDSDKKKTGRPATSPQPRKEQQKQQLPESTMKLRKVDFYSRLNIQKSKSRQRRTHYFQRGFHPMSDHFQTLLSKPQYQFGDKNSMALLNKSFETVSNFNRVLQQEFDQPFQVQDEHTMLPSKPMRAEDDDVVQFSHPNQDLDDVAHLPIQEVDRDSCSTNAPQYHHQHPGRKLRATVSLSHETQPTLMNQPRHERPQQRSTATRMMSHSRDKDVPLQGPMPYSSLASSLHSKEQSLASKKKDLGYYLKQYSKGVKEASNPRSNKIPVRPSIPTKVAIKQPKKPIEVTSDDPTTAIILSNTASDQSLVASPPSAGEKIMRFLHRPESSLKARPLKLNSKSQTIKSPEATNETSHDIEKLHVFLDVNLGDSSQPIKRGAKTAIQASHQRLPATTSPEGLFVEPTNDVSPYASRRLKSVSQLHTEYRSGLQGQRSGSQLALKQKLSYASITQMAAAVEKVLGTSNENKPSLQTLKPRVRPWTGNATRAQRSLNAGNNRTSQTIKAGDPVFKVFHKSSNSNSQLNRQSTQMTTIGAAVRDRNRKLTSSIGALTSKIRSSGAKTRNPRGSEQVFSKLIDEAAAMESPLKRSQVYQPNFFTINAQLPEEEVRPSKIIPRAAAIAKQMEISKKFKEYFTVSSKPKPPTKKKEEQPAFDFLDHYIEMRLNGVDRADAVTASHQVESFLPQQRHVGSASCVPSDIESKKSRTLTHSEFLVRMSSQNEKSVVAYQSYHHPPRSTIEPQKPISPPNGVLMAPAAGTPSASNSPSKKFSTRLDLSFIHRQRRDPSKKKPWK